MNLEAPKILVVIPCYNEQSTVADVVAEINLVKSSGNLKLDALVVNDCSTDGTVTVVRSLDCLYLDLPVNLGIGGAMQAGYKYAYREGYDIAIQVDGDGQHPADEIPRLINPLIQGHADVSIGSRFLTKEGFQSSFTRRMGIKYFRWLNQVLIGQTIHDSTSGFRAFNRKTLAIVNNYYPDEYPEPEAIVQFGLHRLRMVELPVNMRERQGGISSIDSTKAIYYMLKVTLGILFVFIRLRSKAA